MNTERYRRSGTGERERAKGEKGRGEGDRPTQGGGQRVLLIHAVSRNPQIILDCCLEFQQRRQCEMTFSKKSKGRQGSCKSVA